MNLNSNQKAVTIGAIVVIVLMGLGGGSCLWFVIYGYGALDVIWSVLGKIFG